MFKDLQQHAFMNCISNCIACICVVVNLQLLWGSFWWWFYPCNQLLVVVIYILSALSYFFHLYTIWSPESSLSHKSWHPSCKGAVLQSTECTPNWPVLPLNWICWRGPSIILLVLNPYPSKLVYFNMFYLLHWTRKLSCLEIGFQFD